MTESTHPLGKVCFRELDVHSGTTPLLRGLSLTVPANSITALVGPSGAGKSLTAKAGLGLLNMRPGVTGGRVVVTSEGATHGLYTHPNGTGEHRRACKSIRGRLISLVPQAPRAALDPLQTVARQIAEVLRLSQPKPGPEAVCAALSRAGFPDPLRVGALYPHELSGGMAQRVCIAQALARRSRFLFADEPVSGLDPCIAASILDQLRDIADRGVGVLLITHDLRVATRYAERIAVIHRGHIIEDLPADRLDDCRHPITQSLMEATMMFVGDRI